MLTYMRTLAKVEHAVTTQSTVHHDVSYVISATVDIDGLLLTPYKIGFLMEVQRKHELLHFGYVAKWESFRTAVIHRQLSSIIYQNGRVIGETP
jgi:hypothetical protein